MRDRRHVRDRDHLQSVRLKRADGIFQACNDRDAWPFADVADAAAAMHPDLVVHGHAHAGQFEGFIGAVPVYNVAVPVTGRDFWIFELPGPAEEPKVEQKVVEKRAV